MSKVEVLAPAGNMDALKAAIAGGANAVYLAGKAFGARSFAGNFSKEELEEAVFLCHLSRVKIYITVNTLIYDSEVDAFMKYIEFLYYIGVDALIMQDLGMIDLVRQTFPDFEIHASTQANIHNLDGAKFCESIGIKRVVLARETPIELIKEIKENTSLEIEIFVHGALCMSYSGECLMSALIGPRSGNRGTCAQCCRQPYSLEVNDKIVDDGYLLSTKDLNTLDYVKELIKIGVDSLKIEGRMKRPEYVYYVTSLYSTLAEQTEDVKKELKKLFNRRFTKGFLFHEENDNFLNTYRPNHMGIKIGEVVNFKKGYKINYIDIKLYDDLNINDGIRIIGDKDNGCTVLKMYINKKEVTHASKGDIITIEYKDYVSIGSEVRKTTDETQLSRIRKTIEEKFEYNIGRYVSIFAYIKVGEPLKIRVVCDAGQAYAESDFIVEKAKNKPTEIWDNLTRFGDTIYKLDRAFINDGRGCEDVFIPISVINETRRKALENLTKVIKNKREVKKEKYNPGILPDYSDNKYKSILVHTKEDYDKYSNDYDIVYIDSKSEFDKLNSSNCILKIPRINERLPEYNLPLLISDVGGIYKYKKVDTDFSLNVINSYTVAFLHRLGVNKITLSYELTYNQVKSLIDNYHSRYNKHPNLEVITSSYAEAMVCKYNMLSKYKVEKGHLIDRFNNKYYVKIKDNLMYIFDYKKTILKDDYHSIGVNYIRVNK